MQIRGSRQVQTWYWSTRPFSAALVFVLTISEMKCEYKKTALNKKLIITFLLSTEPTKGAKDADKLSRKV